MTNNCSTYRQLRRGTRSWRSSYLSIQFQLSFSCAKYSIIVSKRFLRNVSSSRNLQRPQQLDNYSRWSKNPRNYEPLVVFHDRMIKRYDRLLVPADTNTVWICSSKASTLSDPIWFPGTAETWLHFPDPPPILFTSSWKTFDSWLIIYS